MRLLPWIPVFLYYFYWASLFYVRDVYGLRNVRVSVPNAVELGQNANLSCTYDLDGDLLYTLKWYKGEQEFYRYTPKESPPIKDFQVVGLPDLKVLKEESNASQVVLKKVTRNMSGKYTCEVTTDAPSFHAVTSSNDMQVVSLPAEIPQIRSFKDRYKDGEKMNVTCESLNSKPAANLTWTVNESRKLDKPFEIRYDVTVNANGMESARSWLAFNISGSHFHNNNNGMKIKCTATMYNIYQKVTEISVLMDKPPNKIIYQPETRQKPILDDSSDPIYPHYRNNKAEVAASAAENIHRIAGNNLPSQRTPAEMHSEAAEWHTIIATPMAFLIILVQLCLLLTIR